MSQLKNKTGPRPRDTSFFIVLFSCIFFAVGCGVQMRSTALGMTAKQIKQGMTQEQVGSLFKGFYSSSISDFHGGLKNHGDSFDKHVAFQTNTFTGFQVNYCPLHSGALSSFEICTVYFDTNKIVMGYEYSLDH